MKFTIRFDSRVTGEGQYTERGVILVGSKFFKMPRDQQINVILHEIGHELSDRMLKDLSAFTLQDEGAFGKKDERGLVWGINGARTPGENIAEGYAVLIQDSRWLKTKYPKAYAAIKARAKKENLLVTVREAGLLLNRSSQGLGIRHH